MQIVTNTVSYAARVISGKPAEEVPNAVSSPTAVLKAPPEAISLAASEAIPESAPEVAPDVSRDPESDERQNTKMGDSSSKPTYFRGWKDRYFHKRDQLAACVADLNEARLAFDAAKRELRAERERSQSLALQRDGLRVQLSERENALEFERRQHAAAEDILAKRTAELDAAKALMPAGESTTDTRIVELVQELNYEVVQTATALAEAYEDAVRVRVVKSDLNVKADVLTRLQGCGAIRLLMLQQKTTIDPTTALQIGLQATLVDFASNCLSGGALSYSGDLQAVLGAIKADEPEYVAVKWSALTHKYLRITTHPGVEQDVAGCMASLLGDALVVAGYEDGRLSETDKPAVVLSKVEAQLVTLVRSLIELEITLGESVTVGWMEGFAIAHGTPFRGEDMDAAFESGSTQENGEVICSTALGLCRNVKGKRTVLLRPMVALSSLLPPRAPSSGRRHYGRRT